MVSLGDAIHRPRMLDSVFGPHLKQRLLITGPLMLDSGGFTMMMQDRQLSIAQVARAFSASNADVVVSLDEPPVASDPEHIRRAKHSRTIANFEALRAEGIAAHLAPVVHRANPQELDSSCKAIRRVDSSPAWICVGGLVPLLRQSGQVRQRASAARLELQNTIAFVRKSFPSSRLHVLGAGSPRTIAAAFANGADSVDSIGWRRAAGFGTIFLPGGTERFVLHRDRKRARSRLLLTDEDRDLLARCECPACTRAENLDARIENLAISYMPRAAHNAWVLIGEARRAEFR
jgi:tRNA-guanine family transglycosylase